MAHVLILGMTESGKTTLARQLARRYRARSVGVLVLDPLRDPRWDCDFITSDQEEFLDVFWRSRQCVGFMDEGGESVGRYQLAMQETATRGRHWGHSCHFIAQEATQLAPIVRAQCSHLFAFCMSLRQSKLLAEEFNRPELETCGELAQGEFIHAVKFGLLTKHSNKGDSEYATRVNGNRSGVGGTGSDPSDDKKGEAIDEADSASSASSAARGASRPGATGD